MTIILSVVNMISVLINSIPETVDIPAESTQILIIEDEVEICEAIADLLLIKGYQVTTTENATAAIEELHKTDFEIILTDLMMPGGGAAAVLQACSELAKRPVVILMTGRSDTSLNHEDFPYLPDALMYKPFRLEELLNVIHFYKK